QLFGVQNAVEQFLKVVDRHQLPLGDIAQVGASRQVDGRRKSREEMLGQIEVQIKAGQIAVVLFLHQVDMELREHHAAFRMVGMRQRQKAGRKQALFTD